MTSWRHPRRFCLRISNSGHSERLMGFFMASVRAEAKQQRRATKRRRHTNATRTLCWCRSLRSPALQALKAASALPAAWDSLRFASRAACWIRPGCRSKDLGKGRVPEHRGAGLNALGLGPPMPRWLNRARQREMARGQSGAGRVLLTSRETPGRPGGVESQERGSRAATDRPLGHGARRRAARPTGAGRRVRRRRT